MRYREKKGQERGRKGFLVASMIAAVLVLAFPALAVWAESFSLGKARVVDAPPTFSYEVVEVSFDKPLNLSIGAKVAHRLELVKVVLRGQGFLPKATGPILWLNGIPTLRTQVTEDGTTVEAYFLDSLQVLEEAAARLGRWELLYQAHEGASEVYRISPTGDPAVADSQPTIRRLSPAERQRVETLKRQFRIEEADRER